MTTAQFLLSGWTWNPAVLAARRGALVDLSRRVSRPVAASAGSRRPWRVFLLTLVSPLNALADGYLFSAHMAAAHPAAADRAGVGCCSACRGRSRWPVRPRVFAHPLVGWVAGVGAMWFWHAPALCNAAVASRPVHALQTVSLLALGGVFWWQILAPREEERLSPPARGIYLFSACVACSVLGIIITFSPVAVCSIYTHAADRPARHAADHSRRTGV